MASPFITEPSSPVFAQENATKKFVWVIENCSWEVRVVTEKYTLYPNIDPTRVPIKTNTDYNVSITPEVYLCEESTINTSVSLSITFKKNVLQYVEYVICKVFRNDEMMYKSRVNLIATAPPPAETTMTAETMTTEILMTEEETVTLTSVTDSKKLSMPTEVVDTATDSGYSQSIHFGAVLFCLLVLFCCYPEVNI